MKRVFIDMDNVLVDFQSGLDQVSEETKAKYPKDKWDEIPGLFGLMKPMPGAIEAVHELKKTLRSVHPFYSTLEESVGLVGQSGVGDKVS